MYLSDEIFLGKLYKARNSLPVSYKSILVLIAYPVVFKGSNPKKLTHLIDFSQIV